VPVLAGGVGAGLFGCSGSSVCALSVGVIFICVVVFCLYWYFVSIVIFSCVFSCIGLVILHVICVFLLSDGNSSIPALAALWFVVGVLFRSVHFMQLVFPQNSLFGSMWTSILFLLFLVQKLVFGVYGVPSAVFANVER